VFVFNSSAALLFSSVATALAPACRHAPPRCTAVTPSSSACVESLPGFGPDLIGGLPATTHVSDVASLLVDCFYSSGWVAESDGTMHAGATSPGEDELPSEYRSAPAPLQERWRLAAKGLQWRLGARLDDPSMAASMETSLMLVLQERASARLIACAELSLRPVDGKLPGEFAVPPLFLLHTEAQLGAYLSNLAVRPSYRRQGLAKQLLSACETLVRDKWDLPALYLHVDLHNTAAAQLYEACGYEQLERYDKFCQPPVPPDQAPRVLNRYHRKVLR